MFFLIFDKCDIKNLIIRLFFANEKLGERKFIISGATIGRPNPSVQQGNRDVDAFFLNLIKMCYNPSFNYNFSLCVQFRWLWDAALNLVFLIFQ